MIYVMYMIYIEIYRIYIYDIYEICIYNETRNDSGSDISTIYYLMI